METPAWILVVILSLALLTFLILGIVLIVLLINLSREAKKVIIEGQDIAKNANGIVANVKGMTSIGGTMELFVDKYIMPKLKAKIKEEKEKRNGHKDE